MIIMLNRKSFDKYITDTYGITAEYPWGEDPGHAVYRHTSNKKWFAVSMIVHKSKFGLTEDCSVDVVNLKCDPLMIGSLHREKGIFPAYHMNKTYWISVFLDGTVDDETIKWLVDISFMLTDKPKKK